jgi:hypothetical protein
MNAMKPCKDRFEDIVALVMGELDSSSARELQEHLTLCDKCRAAHAALAEEEKDVRSGFAALARRLGPAEHAALGQQRHARVRADVSDDHFLERVKNMILTHKRLSVAAAMVTALAATVLLCLPLFSSPNSAYALEQTVQANNHVTSYHARLSPSLSGMSDVWVQLNADGTPLRARIDYPKTEDGAKVVICSEGKTAIWFKDKKGYTVVPEAKALDRVVAMQKICDPRLAFERLEARKKAGKVKIETESPANENGFLKLTVTPTDAPDRQLEVYEVNPTTKLAERVTYYGRRRGGQWKEVKLIEYFDYNKPIDPKVFDLDLPKDVVKVDEIKRPPGLVKGNLTNEQIAAKVAREFLEALIAKDYDKAGLLYGGFPAEKIKASFGRLNVSRIVEVGPPTAGMHPDPTALAVSVKVECGGQKPRTWIQTFTPQIRLTDSQTAKKAAREFLEAIIRRDVAAVRRSLDAGVVFDGFSGKNSGEVKEFFEYYRVHRIVEVGKPAPLPETDRLEVPIKVELEMKSERNREFLPYIRPVYNQPNRWEICGGI